MHRPQVHRCAEFVCKGQILRIKAVQFYLFCVMYVNLNRLDRDLSPPLSAVDSSVLHLFFYYLMNLNILTVKAKVSTSADLSGAISAG